MKIKDPNQDAISAARKAYWTLFCIVVGCALLKGCNRMNWTDGAPEYHPITRAVIIKPEDKEAEQ